MLTLIATTLLAAAASGQQAAPAAATWQDCASCHEEVVASFAATTHARLKSWEVADGDVGCAACHGDPAAHLESGDASTLRRFGQDTGADSAACLSCHAARGMSEWEASAHAGEVACTTCHSMHKPSAPNNACAACHSDVQSIVMHSPSRHPLLEGKMTCASCHDVHAANPGALKTDERKNDLCVTCHTAQEGPFVFEHAPVQEDCMICHQPHGSVANNLLVANDPYLCLQCHEFHFHAGYRSEEATSVTVGGKTYPNVMGEHGYQKGFATKCTQCHVKVHGTDLPSQSVPGSGRALVR